ncbi:hypothetical protein HG535_0A00370 [Zygotorulaspora mrakii]|uniref:Spindle pole body component KRE28 n=1 Tax=Zygotorulaspora mrakii TaxID=42260 RepID=A0A7H9AVD6_ZYGMR|nr:uncharacterized protein HG535_0A00370 [Zygotorulaspora mrakii]QLG70097.1 hypothetical protein HG535_0A00370 [Zygotorulaspora mrakii]
MTISGVCEFILILIRDIQRSVTKGIMSFESLHDYKTEIGNLENEIAKVSDEVLIAQERRFSDAVNEITQSVVTMSRESELIRILDNSDENLSQIERQIVDFGEIDKKIDAFNQLVDLLRVTYLEQETLDFFLRYTISSSELLHLDSIHDDKYVKLEEEVSNLKDTELRKHHVKIEETKLKIAVAGDNLAKTEDKVNEILLETTEVLDSCDQMMEELEKLREEYKIRNDRRENSDHDPLMETYHQWGQLKKTQGEYNILNDQLSEWEKVKKTYDFIGNMKRSNSSISDTDPRLVELGSTLESLIKIWEAKFLPAKGWQNLEVYPQTRKFQFDVSAIFTVVITLDDFSLIEDMKVYRKEEDIMRNDKNIENKLKKDHLGAKDIFNVMVHIINNLK